MIKIAVIGAGQFGLNLLHAFAQHERTTGLCKLAAFADTNEAILVRRKDEFGISGYADYRRMLEREDLDAVAVATPDPYHREITVYAASMGKHVLVEKPMDVTVEGCAAMIDAAQRAGVLLQVDFHKRYDPYHREIEKLVRQGELGRIEYGYAHMEDRIEYPLEHFPGWAPKSSPVWFLGVHFIDLMRWILKSDGSTVYATGRKWKLASMGVDTYDSVTAQVRFTNDAVITFDMSWILPGSFEANVNQGFRLIGEEGIIECDTQDRGVRSCIGKKGMQTHNMGFIQRGIDLDNRPYYTGYGVDSIIDFIRNIEAYRRGVSREALRNHGVALGEDGLETTRIATAIHRSLRSGQVENV